MPLSRTEEMDVNRLIIGALRKVTGVGGGGTGPAGPAGPAGPTGPSGPAGLDSGSKSLYSGGLFPTINNITTQVDLLNGVGAGAIPANSLAVGDILVFDAAGKFTNTHGTLASTMGVQFGLGSLLDGTNNTVSVIAVTGSRLWQMHTELVVANLSGNMFLMFAGGMQWITANNLGAPVIASGNFTGGYAGYVFGALSFATAYDFKVMCTSTQAAQSSIGATCFAASLRKVAATGVAAVVDNYRHVQAVASTSWVITHGLGFRPNVAVVDSTGREIIPEIDYTSPTVVTLTFSAAVAGEAYLS